MDNIQLVSQTLSPIPPLIDGIIPKHQKQIPDSKLIELRTHGLSYRQIEQLTGIDHSSIFLRLKSIGYEDKELNSYKNYKADLLAQVQKKIIFSIDDEAIKKAPLQTKIYAYGVLYDKERLERDLATQITKYDGLPDTQIAAIVCNNLNSLGGLDKLLDKIPADKRDQVRGLLSNV
jgi:hypothetical protein